MAEPAHLDPSELGTKEYWDNLYATELRNHADNPADTGTVWFDDADAEAKMVAFLEDEDEGASEVPHRVLDLGCGNGSLLRAVRDGYRGRWTEPAKVVLLGVDYSAASVQLARSIEEGEDCDDDDDDERSEEKEDDQKAKIERSEEKKVERSEEKKIERSEEKKIERSEEKKIERSEEKKIERSEEIKEKDERSEDQKEIKLQFQEWDILTGQAAVDFDGQPWDLVLDKGTFDAISLGAAAAAATTAGAQVERQYARQVRALLRRGGRFLITSCNWTEAELEAWMCKGEEENQEGEGKLVKIGRVEYPRFSFGGVQGQAVVTVCF